MAFNIILPEQASCVIGVLNNPNALYIIPSFQRPYSWGKKEIDDLQHDMAKAGQMRGHHYLAAIHLLQLDIANVNGSLENFIQYARETITPAVEDDRLTATNGGPVNVFVVIDGQQRLTTLFFLAHKYYKDKDKVDPQENYRTNLEVRTLVNGKIMSFPRLIQNPPEDHVFMMEIVKHIWDANHIIPEPTTQAQRRMLAAHKQMNGWEPEQIKGWEPTTLGFLNSPRFRTMVIALEREYGLGSFMSLNDRGKPLTTLEKLKSLIIQFAHDAGAANIIPNILGAFGGLYKAIDACLLVGLFLDGQEDYDIVKLLSCYIRLESDAQAVNQGTEEAYEKFFRPRLLQAAEQIANQTTAPNNAIIQILNVWIQDITDVGTQLIDLCSYLSPHGLGTTQQSIHYANFKLQDDYRATLLSLRIQPQLLALLLKFKRTYNVPLHQQFPVATINPNVTAELAKIHVFINKIRVRAVALQSGLALLESDLVQPLINYLDALLKKPIPTYSALSALQIVERQQVLTWNLWSKPVGNFAAMCQSALVKQLAQDFIITWNTWNFNRDFIGRLLETNDYNESNLAFLLKEYERTQTSGHNLHFDFVPAVSDSTIARDHIFPQNMTDADLLLFGFANREEFQQNCLQRSGNITWLAQKCNVSLGNTAPHIKATHYSTCSGHPVGSAVNVAAEIKITKKIGDELQQFGTCYPAMRLYIEARCAELAIFALRRFC